MTKILQRSDYPKIRRMARTKRYTQTELGNIWGVTQSTIHLIVARKGKYAPRPKSPPGEKRKIIIQGNPYYVYADGRVWSKFQSKFLSVKVYTDRDGYKHILVRLNSRLYRLSRLLLECFIGPAPSKLHQACHNNGNSLDNKLRNLRWDIPQGNSDDKYAHRRQPHGDNHFRTKITEKILYKLKQDWIKSGLGLHAFSTRIGKKYGWSDNTVWYAIKTRKNYKQLEKSHKRRLNI
jgi:DNA-binding XRE family transcriptional regulator